MKKGLLLIIAIIFIAFNSNAQTTISDIQGTGDVSPLEGSVVTVSGVVTAVRAGDTGIFGFFIQDGNGTRTGIYVYSDLNQSLVLGDSITVTGEVDEYYNMTELTDISAITINSSGNALPNPALITTNIAGSSEDYEGVLVKVQNANCTAVPDTHGIWTVNDGSGNAFVDDWMFHLTPDATVGTKYDITGCLIYDFSQYKICPRDANDVAVVSSSSVNNITTSAKLFPNPTSVELNIQSKVNIYNINVSNVIGQKVLNISNINAKNYTLNVADLTKGVYMISINNTDGTTAVTKFVKK